MKVKNFGSSLFGLLIITVLSIIVLLGGRAVTENGPQTVRAEAAPSPSSHTGPVSEPNAETLLRETIARLDSLSSLSAEMTLTFSLFDRRYEGTGKYEELAGHTDPSRTGSTVSPIDRTQFRLHVKMAPQSAKQIEQGDGDNLLEIVCDRNSLWTYTSIGGNQRLTEINLDELSGLIAQLSESELRQLAERGATLPSGMDGFPGLGGMTGTLRALACCYDFDPVPEQRAFNSGSFPVLKITGTMKSALYEKRKKEILGDNPAFRLPLLDYLPTGVEIYIGRERPFPYRIEYFAQLDHAKDARKTIMTLDFNRVFENVTSVGPNSFVYAPKINSERVTKQYLEKLIPGLEW